MAQENWEPLSDKVAEVKELVGKIIGLDFDGFTKAVVLPQGEFDRFLRGGANERRQILEELLRLDIYARMGELAREHTKHATIQKEMLERDLVTTYAEATPENKTVLEKELERLSHDEQETSARLDILRDAHPWALELRQLRKKRSEAEKELQDLQKKLGEAQAILRRTGEEIQQQQKQIQFFEIKIQKTGYDEKRHFELVSLIPLVQKRDELKESVTAKLAEKRRKLETLAPVQRSLTDSAKVWETCKATLKKAEQNALETKGQYDALRKQHGSAELIAETLEDYQGIEAKLGERDGIKQSIEKLNSQYASLQERVTLLAKEDKAAQAALDDAVRALEHLQQLHAADDLRRHLKKGEACPVCEQIVKSIPRPGERAALDSAKQAVAERRAAKQQSQTLLLKSQSELSSLPKEIKATEKTLQALQAGILGVNNKVERILGKPPGPKAVAELRELAKRITDLEGKGDLASKEWRQAQTAESKAREAFSRDEHQRDLLQQKLKDLDREIDESDKRRRVLEKQRPEWPALAALQKELKIQEDAKEAKEGYERQKKQAEDLCRMAEQSHAGAKTNVANFTDRTQECEALIKASQSGIGKLEQKLDEKLSGFELPDGVDEAARLEKKRSALEKLSHDLGSAVAVTATKLQTVVKQIAEAEEKRKQARAELYRELGIALKADQFIRFVLEEALRRLATDGTKQLQMLSSGRYSFWTGGDDFLVIDHWNADEKRSVNTLSGGESFLASLSLALALAESLSSFTSDREQFALDSLFLDEGFSTLDLETMDVVVQGIEALAGGDRLIGVISHVSELAERFPVRIQVNKAISGSTISVARCWTS